MHHILPEDREAQAWLAAMNVKKSEFALSHALMDEEWTIPRYIRDGLLWLAKNAPRPPAMAQPNPGTSA
jgi:hypothetical protein